MRCMCVAVIMAALSRALQAEQSPLPVEILYNGRLGGQPEQVPLRAGPLAMVFEGGDLRYIRLGDREVLRRWYAVTRDRNWGTLENRLSNVRIEAGTDSFHIQYDVSNQDGDIDFVWKGDIRGERDGTIVFSFDGEARSDFLRNRIGFCLLHPARECPGARCRSIHADGRVVESTFPEFIAPGNPFQELTGFAHEVLPGLWAHLTFEGDLFEMEDQRNWVDASFKTFCTPLRLPYPAPVKRGERITQRVTLRLQGEVPHNLAARTGPLVIERLAETRTASQAKQPSVSFEPDGSERRLALPQLGLGIASGPAGITERQIERLRSLHLAHLRVDLKLADPAYAETFREAARQATALGVQLEVALFLSDSAEMELGQLVRLAEQFQPPVCRWLVFRQGEHSTTGPWIKLAKEHLQRLGPSVKIGAGSNANFTELNRGRPPLDHLDVVSFALNPQVHAFDNRSLVETLEAHSAVIASARQFSDGKSLAVTPITLRPRFNPVATAAGDPLPPDELPPQVDVRQMSLFGAAWTLGSLKYVAESGQVDSVTYYETVGWRGVMESDAGSPLPAKFPSLPGSVFPMYHVFADVGEMAGGSVLRVRSSDTLRTDCLVLEKGDRQIWLVANLTAEPLEMLLRGVPGPGVVRRLNERTALHAMTQPEAFRAASGEPVPASDGVMELKLLPYEICRVAFELPKAADRK